MSINTSLSAKSSLQSSVPSGFVYLAITCGSGDVQDGGSRVSPERAGEAEWSEGREGKTEQEDVQSGLK